MAGRYQFDTHPTGIGLKEKMLKKPRDIYVSSQHIVGTMNKYYGGDISDSSYQYFNF